VRHVLQQRWESRYGLSRIRLPLVRRALERVENSFPDGIPDHTKGAKTITKHCSATWLTITQGLAEELRNLEANGQEKDGKSVEFPRVMPPAVGCGDDFAVFLFGTRTKERLNHLASNPKNVYSLFGYWQVR